MTITTLNKTKVWGGFHSQHEHYSELCNCTMRFAVFLPEGASPETPAPVLYWLSGLTCTDENFMQKAGAMRMASDLGIAIVAPDTSPRGENVADDEAYDLGQGAGFYVNATERPWKHHFQMYDYIVTELPKLIETSFPVSHKKSIAGHSMGGHGALMIGLRNPDMYESISAFSPITNPVNCPWGQKAFTAYLGDNTADWEQYDACYLLAQATTHKPILVDQGDADSFMVEQLRPEALVNARTESAGDFTARMQPGYDHSYYFIATFIDEHLTFHAKALKGE